MSSIQTTSTPINGEEAKKFIQNQFDKLLDNTPGLDFASAYHKFTVKGEFEITAYPADVPTPKKEFEFDIKSITANQQDFLDEESYLQRLSTIREELIHRLDEITQYLDDRNPITRVEFDLDTIDPIDGQSKPDKLRIEQGLQIPVVTKSAGRSIETYVDVEKKSNGGFQFGRRS